MNEPTFFDMFSGIGGFKLAFENAGFKSVGFCEIDPYSRKLYKAYFNTEGEYECHDATRINPNKLPEFDVLVGGFPCQAFSIAGKRLGFDDTRGTLFFDIVRICQEKRPRYILLENVKGLLSHDGGKTFQTILGLLAEIGYQCEWQVLNSRDFGVPQNRERVFIAGYYGKRAAGQIFPLRESDKIYYEPSKAQKEICNLASTLKARDYSSWNGNFVVYPLTEVRSEQAKQIRRENKRKFGKDFSPRRAKDISIKKDGIIGALTSSITPEQHVIEITQNVSQGYRVYSAEGIGCCLQSQSGGVGAKTGLYCVASRGRNTEGKYQQTAELRDDGLTNSLTSFSKDNYILNGYSIRRLTPLECFRLQGFPDGMIDTAKQLNLSDNRLYKMAGNAVTVQVVESIARKIKAGIDG